MRYVMGGVVCDEVSMGVSKVSEMSGRVNLLNRFDILQHVGSDERDEAFETKDVTPTYSMMSCDKNGAYIKQRGLRIGTLNFHGLGDDRKALEVGELLYKNHIDITGGQESWELDNSKIYWGKNFSCKKYFGCREL